MKAEGGRRKAENRPRAAAWHREPAQVLDLVPGCLSFPVWAEPKADGVRAVAVLDAEGRVSIRSRGGVVYECPRIAAELSQLLQPSAFNLQPCVLDGEIAGGSFGQTLSAIQSGYDEGLRFHVWDALTFAEWAVPVSPCPHVPASPSLQERHARLEQLLPRDGQRVSGHFRLGLRCEDQADADRAFHVFRASGYEGAVYKRLDAPYPQALSERSESNGGVDWYRRKQHVTIDAPIVGVERGRGRLAATVGAIVVDAGDVGDAGTRGHGDAENGGELSPRPRVTASPRHLVRIGCGLTDQVRAELAAAGPAAIGRVVEFRQEVSPASGRAAPAVFVRMRPDKRGGVG